MAAPPFGILPEHGVEAAVVQEAEAADLVAFVIVVAGENAERRCRHAEHADLLIEVAEVRRLEELRLEVERDVARGAEEARVRRRRIGLRIERMAAVADVGPIADNVRS